MKEHPELEEFKKKRKGKHWTTKDKEDWITLYAKLYRENGGKPTITYLN